uniref:Uncharacterized protein n=1 Tax=Rhizophora mucronata TaxID=61149 RepID=A0A2P2IJ19_RHIMU
MSAAIFVWQIVRHTLPKFIHTMMASRYLSCFLPFFFLTFQALKRNVQVSITYPLYAPKLNIEQGRGIFVYVFLYFIFWVCPSLRSAGLFYLRGHWLAKNFFLVRLSG